jgi:hypothetical protein
MMCARAAAFRSIASRAVLLAARRQLFRHQHSRPAEHGVERRSELVRHRGEEVVLETIGLVGVFFGGLRLHRRDDQPLVRFAELDVQPLDVASASDRAFRGADGVLAQRDRLFPGANRRLTAAQRPVLRGHRLCIRRGMLRKALRRFDRRFLVRLHVMAIPAGLVDVECCDGFPKSCRLSDPGFR